MTFNDLNSLFSKDQQAAYAHLYSESQHVSGDNKIVYSVENNFKISAHKKGRLESFTDTIGKTFNTHAYQAKCKHQEFLKSKLETQLKNEVISVITTLENKLATDPSAITHTQKNAIKRLFFETLAKLPEDIFSRSLIKKKGELEKLLSEGALQGGTLAIGIAREKYESLQRPVTTHETDKIAEATEIGEALLNLIESEAELAIALGVMPVAAGAASTSFYLRDLAGKKIAIFKPEDLGPRSPHKLASGVKAWFASSILGQKSIRQAKQHVGEVVSYKASLNTGALNVPPTKITSLACEVFAKSGKKIALKEGSLQAFVPGCTTAKDFLGAEKLGTLDVIKRAIKDWASGMRSQEPRLATAPDKLKNLDRINTGLYRHFMMLDFLTGQIDRHFENWMILAPQTESTQEAREPRVALCIDRLFRLDETGNAIVLIDGGASFPKGHIKMGLETRHQYLEAELPIGEKPIYDPEMPLHLPPDWDTKILDDLLQASLIQDIPKNQDARKPIEATLRAIINAHIDPTTGRVSKMPSQGNLETELKEKIKSLPKGTTSTHLAKIVLQVLGTVERIAIIKCFLNPPAGQEHEYTFRRLSRISTGAEVENFWKEHRGFKNKDALPTFL